jgi:hypothetical protein
MKMVGIIVGGIVAVGFAVYSYKKYKERKEEQEEPCTEATQNEEESLVRYDDYDFAKNLRSHTDHIAYLVHAMDPASVKIISQHAIAITQMLTKKHLVANEYFQAFGDCIDARMRYKGAKGKIPIETFQRDIDLLMKKVQGFGPRHLSTTKQRKTFKRLLRKIHRILRTT